MDEQAKRQDENQNTHPLPNHSVQNTPLHEPGAGGQTHKLEHPTQTVVSGTAQQNQGHGQENSGVFDVGSHSGFSTNHPVVKPSTPQTEEQKKSDHLGVEKYNVPMQHLSSIGEIMGLESNQFESNRQNSIIGIKSGEATPQFDNAALGVGSMEQLFSQEHLAALSQEKDRKINAKQVTIIPESDEPEETFRENSQTPPNRESQPQLQTATFSRPEDLNYRTTQQDRNIDQDVYKSMQAPSINIETSSAEEIQQSLDVTPISINRELYVRLVKTGVIKEYENKESKSLAQIQESTAALQGLTSQQTVQYLNGLLFGRYLVFLKKHMKRLWNQIWSIKVGVIKNLKHGHSEDCRSLNWNLLNAELDKISITIKDESLEKLRKGQQAEVDSIFNRIERYSKIITDASFLKFQQVEEIDKYADDMDETTVYDQAAYTEENISEMISLRQNTLRSNGSKPSLARKITRGLTKLSSKFNAPQGIKNPPEKSLTQMMDNSLRIRNQRSDYLNTSNESPGQRPHMRIAQDFGSENMEVIKLENAVSPKPTTSALHTEFDVMNSRDDKQLHNTINQAKLSMQKHNSEPKKKTVKDGVDILNLDIDKPIRDCDSSLELILVTLSIAFQMSPKQAAALLTNNNQYLITACIKGVKGGRYEPLINWYELLMSNCETLSTLLRLEMEQLPGSAKQTFAKVMAAVGCGFFSYNIELVYMTFSLFTQLYDKFQASSEQILEQALKWFLSQVPIQQATNQADTTVASLIADQKAASNQIDYVNTGGLKMTLYAIGKHREATKHAILLFNVLIQADEQTFKIYGTEIQSHTKSTLEYMELVGEFLPIMAEIMPEQAVDSGLVDYWLDLCSREAENEMRIQNQEKVLAISLLAEIWLLFTDYIDEREEVTNTLIFVFKRTVSERTKSIRILSIAHLFKVLEKLINLKKKAALTLYRTLIFSLVESPFDPTIRELYLKNFAELYQSNPKIPVEWLAEPLLKQIQVQYGATWVLKIFDLTFMMTLLDHPKFREEQALQMYNLFAQVSLDDTSYCTAAQIIMLKTVERFLATPNKTALLEKVQEYVSTLFEQLNDLEPITRLAAQNQLKRQFKQSINKQSSGSIGGRSGGQSSITTPNKSLKPPLKVRDILGVKQQPPGLIGSLGGGVIKGQNYQKEMLRKHRKSLAITHLLKLQALSIKDINAIFLKELTFEKTREFKSIYGYFNKGHLEILKYYGDVQTLIQDHELDPQLAEQQRLEAQENNKSLQNNSRRSLGRQHNSQVALKIKTRAPSRGEISGDNRIGSESKEVALYGGPTEDFSRSVVPFQENVNTRASKSVGRAKAIQELERIKKLKKDREQQKEAEEEKLRQASANRKKRARVEIEKRKKELGIEDRAFSQNYKLAVLGQADQQVENRLSLTFKTKQVVYINMADEEERDRESVFEFMRKYQKLWRNIFAKYQNTGHKTNALRNPNFDQIQSKAAELSFAEITKMLKDHATYPRLINKDELSQMVRIVNQKSDEQKNDIQSLSYAGYQTFLIQLANHCFSRPPQDLSSQPMVKSMQALITTFEEATRSRKLSTLLYEDPDAVIMSQKDKDLLKQLNEKVQEEPDYPLPDGFLKLKEKVPVFNHTVPQATVPYIGMAKAVCVELVDELLSQLFDFHVLEPIVTMEEKFRVKPSMQRSAQVHQIGRGKDQASSRAEALSIIRRAEERKGNSEASELNSRSTNRNNLPKIGQTLLKKALTAKDLPPIYKKVIEKQSKADRAIFEETSLVLENLIQKVCAEEELTQRDLVPQSRDDHHKNLVKLLPLEENLDSNKYMERKALIDKQNAQEKRLKEKQRQERQKKLKQELAKLKEEKQIKEEEDAQIKLEEEKKKKEQNQKLEEKRKKRLEDQKQEALNKQETKEEVMDPEAAATKAEAQRKLEKQKAKEKRDFFRKQQEKLNDQFKAASDQRKEQKIQEQQEVIKKLQKKESLKRIIDQQSQQDNGHRERQLAADIVNFMAKQENKQVFAEHEKSLKKYFKYFCKQGRFELGHDLQFRLEHLDFTSFNKMGLQSKIVPVLISSEQLKTTFRNSIKQFQNAASAEQEGPSAISQRSPSDLGNASATSQYIDFENFKKALVRIAIQGQELLGGQSEEQKQSKAEIDEKKRQAEQRKKELMKNRQEQRARFESETLADMRAEFMQKQRQIQNVLSKSPAKAAKKLESVKSEGELQNSSDTASQVPINEEDFQKWLKQQDAIGNGLNSRVNEKMNKAKPRPAPHQLSANNDLETPVKSVINPDAEADLDEGEVEGQENIGTSPLQRAKQSAQQEKIETSVPINDELDINLISADTIKALLAFMHVEVGEKGEKSIDQVLAAQNSKERRGTGANQIKRGISKDPAAQTNQEQQRN